jgi:hypothetical protein
MAPGQIYYLWRFTIGDLLENNTRELKTSSFTIIAEYDGPRDSILNWLLSIPSRLRRKKRFRTEYTFTPQMVNGDYPPTEYS